jgi:tripartite ATP-independent transporter DctM subunit
MFVSAFGLMIFGFPVAFTLAGAGIAFAGLGALLGVFPWPMLSTTNGRILDLLINETLLAVPLFVFMGVVLERSKIAEKLLLTMGQLFGGLRGGLGISVVLVGALLAASTGIVGATVVTMGLISLPAMLQAKYDKPLAAGVICASGTLAQLIPPSTVLILLGMTLQNATTQANLRMGKFGGSSVSITDLFGAALLPGLVMVLLYIGWLLFKAWTDPESCPPIEMSAAERRSLGGRVLKAMLPPLVLIVVVLGSILGGFATATESAALGALGAVALAIVSRRFSLAMLREVAHSTLVISTMIFAILLGATIFTLVFRGLGGEDVVIDLISLLPGGQVTAVIFVLLLIFLLGFIIDTFEIIFIVVPIFGPVLIMLGTDPIWLGVAIAIVLQTSYLTPPFGFAIFYLQGASREIEIESIYRGVIPFTAIQLSAVVVIWVFPELATWLPTVLF